MSIEVMPCPYDTAIEDGDPPTVRRALGAIADWWDVQVLTSPAQTAAAEAVISTVAAFRHFAAIAAPQLAPHTASRIADDLADAVEYARRTLHVVCGSRP